MVRIENKELTIKYLRLIEEGIYLTKIARFLHVSTTAVFKKLKQLEKQNLIEKVSFNPCIYELTGKGKMRYFNLMSQGVRTSEEEDSKKDVQTYFFQNNIGIHNLRVKMEILKRERGGSRFRAEKEVQINNWYKEFIHIDARVNMTIEITTKSVIINFKESNIPVSEPETFRNRYADEIINGIRVVEMKLHGFGFSLGRAEIIQQHLTRKVGEEVDSGLKKGNTVTLDLEKEAETLTGHLKEKAWARGDNSSGAFEAETNDLNYKIKMLQMPLSIDRMKEINELSIAQIRENAQGITYLINLLKPLEKEEQPQKPQDINRVENMYI